MPDLLYWEGNPQRKTCKWQRWYNLKQNNPLSDIRNSHCGGSDSLYLQLGNFLIIWSLFYFLPSNILKSHEKWTLIYWFPHLEQNYDYKNTPLHKAVKASRTTNAISFFPAKAFLPNCTSAGSCISTVLQISRNLIWKVQEML